MCIDVILKRWNTSTFIMVDNEVCVQPLDSTCLVHTSLIHTDLATEADSYYPANKSWRAHFILVLLILGGCDWSQQHTCLIIFVKHQTYKIMNKTHVPLSSIPVSYKTFDRVRKKSGENDGTIRVRDDREKRLKAKKGEKTSKPPHILLKKTCCCKYLIV